MIFRDLGMRQKLLIGFSLVVLLPLLGVTTFSIKFVTDRIEESMEEQVRNALKVAHNTYQEQVVNRARDEADAISRISKAQDATKRGDRVDLIIFVGIKRSQSQALLLEIADENGVLLARSFETYENSPILRDPTIRQTVYLTDFPKYQITDPLLTNLQQEQFPQEFLASLESIKNHVYRTDHQFIDALEKKLGKNILGQYKNLILKNILQHPDADPLLKVGVNFSKLTSITRVQISDGHADDILVRGISQIRTYQEPFGLVIVGYLLNNEFAREVAKITNTYVMVYSGSNPIAFSCDEIVTDKKAPPEIVYPTLQNGEDIVVVQEINDLGEHSVGYKPLRDDHEKIIGMLSVAISRDRITNIKTASLKYLSVSALIALIFALLISHVISLQITDPINKLARGAGAVAEGDLDIQIDVNSKDEIGTFSKIFNNMTASLKEAKRLEEKTIIEAIGALSKALESRDPYSEGHSLRVAEYSRALAKELNMPPSEQELVYQSGLLHDVGKIGIRDAVLLKNGRLTREEFETIKMHPGKGYDIIKNIEFLKNLLPMVHHHHEKVNGVGYPDKLVGDKIPLGARLMAIADVYDALTTDRPYRKGMPQERALGIIEKDAGSHFDADMVKVWLDGFKKGTIKDIRHHHKRRVRVVKSIEEEVHEVEDSDPETPGSRPRFVTQK
ncbi:MAG: hypothetical protein B6244_04725 [Candidatus Cloacimonetes bacterium 4572_55]|nr:MAG: hypothetical protein B6244_04725 [Candidatus Cloacimonetes bacterium 4572_55]